MPEVSQGSLLLATLGFIAESLWDSRSLASIKIRERRSADGRTPSQSPRLVARSRCADWLDHENFVVALESVQN